MPQASGAALCAALAICAASAGPASAQGADQRRVSARHVEVDLIASEPVLAPGRDTWLGVRFRLEPEWHIYWVNPGDSGGPPTVLWEVPAGVEVADFEWPAPERIPLGPLVNYGYEGEVILPFRVKATQAAAGKPVALAGSLRWLICREICVPGRARLVITLPVPQADRGQVESWRRSISDARSRVPGPAPAAWRATARSVGDDFSLVVTLDRPAPSTAVFFPLEVGQVNESAHQTVEATGRQLRLTLRKSDQLGALPRLLRGVLALPDGQAFVVEAPVGVASKGSEGRR